MYAEAAYRYGRCKGVHGIDERALALLRAMMGGAEPGERGERGYGPRRHRGYGRGFGDYGSFGWPPPRPGGRFGRGRKARRGDIRTAALLLLSEEPRNGYQIMQEVEHRSEGMWRPSPGSVYPALQQLEDEGLIRSEETEGRKLFHLTDAGRAAVEKRDPDARAPWEEMSSDYGAKAQELAQAARSVAVAFAQVMRTGDEAQMEQAHVVLRNARRDLYRILAEAEEGQDPSGEEPESGEPESQQD